MNRRLFRTALLIGVVTISGSSRTCAQAGTARIGAERSSFRVRVYNYEGVSPEVLSVAMKASDAMLETAGLKAIWQNCTVGDPKRDLACDEHPTPIDLVLYLVPRLDDHAPYVEKGALGYSVIPGDGAPATMAYVSYRRVRVLQAGFETAELLGLVMAHEMGHLLLGTKAHSNQGILRGDWPRGSLAAGRREDFTFTKRQIRQLRAKVRARTVLAKREAAARTVG
jgi:hypothetical protein